MLGIGKNMGIFLLSITVILSAATLLTTQNLDKSTSTNDVAFVMGHMTLKVIDENGYVTAYRQTDNVIVEKGWDNLVSTVFTGDFTFDDGDGAGEITGAGSAFSHMAIGTGTVPASNSDTTLGLELSGCARSSPLGIIADFSTSLPSTPFTTTSIVTLFGGFQGEPASAGCSGTGPITEAGVFNAASAGTMFAKNTFNPSVPTLGENDFLEIEWDFTFTSTP